MDMAWSPQSPGDAEAERIKAKAEVISLNERAWNQFQSALEEDDPSVPDELVELLVLP